MKSFINLFKKILLPIRKLAGRFVIINLPDFDEEKLISKAGHFIFSNKIEGDYLEFGVFSGQSFVSAFHMIEKEFKNCALPSIWNTNNDCIEREQLWEKMKFIAFDSFEGLPKPSGIDTQSKNFFEGKYANSKENFINHLKTNKVPLDRVKTVSGWFDKTLNDNTIKEQKLKRAAIIHVDCDLYESAKLVLNFVKPLLIDGTVIIFDDWYCFNGNPNLGEQRAFKEWLDENQEWIATEFQKESFNRNSFILNHAPS